MLFFNHLASLHGLIASAPAAYHGLAQTRQTRCRLAQQAAFEAGATPDT